MNTLKPFHVLDGEEYARKRHRPLFVTVTEPDVNELFKPMGVTFADFLAAAMPKEQDQKSQTKDRCRLVEDAQVRQVGFDQVLSDIKRDVTFFSQSFIFEDFEKEGKVSPELSPIPARFPQRIFYGSVESMDPPWYRWSLEKLLEAQMFGNYDFCDFPFCILYGTTKTGPAMTIDKLRQSLKFPTWMAPFVSQIPVVRIVVVDAAYEAEGASSKDGGFNMVLCLPIRAPGEPLDPVDIREWFRFDDEILLNKEKGARFSMQDFERGQTVMKAVKAFADIYRTEKLEQLKKEDNKKKNLKNRLKSLVKKKREDELFLGIQEKKIRHLRLASMLFVDGRVVEAKKTYKYFVKSLKGSFPQLRTFGKFMGTLCTLLVPATEKKKGSFKDEAAKVLKAIPTLKEDVVFMIAVPMLYAEFAARQGELAEAVAHLNFVLVNVLPRLSGRPGDSQILAALIYERMAGLTQEQKKVYRHTLTAGAMYESAGDTGNALRCAIWLEKSLDHNCWKSLYQGQWLKKVLLLETVGQTARSHKETEAILAIPDLDPSLHMAVYDQFMKEVKECIASRATIQIDTLMSVNSARLIDDTSPEYWGYLNGEFRSLNKDIDGWISRGEKSALSYHDYWQGYGKDEAKTEREPVVVLGMTISISVVLHNRYLFDIDLTRAEIEASYEGEQGLDRPFIIKAHPESPNVLRPGATTLIFEMNPKAEGRYTVTSIKVTTWNVVTSVMQIGPLSFTAVRDFPRVQLELVEFPKRLSAGECAEFSIVVRNIGLCPAQDVVVWYDNIPALCALNNDETWNSARYYTASAELAPKESASATFMCRSDTAGIHDLSFVVSVGKLRRLYRRETYSISARLSMEAIVANNAMDTSNQMIHVTVRSYINNLKIIGIMNERGRLLKTMKASNDLVNPGQTYSLAAFVCDELPDTVEPWRVKMMGGRQYALLMDFGTDSKYYSQALINTNVPSSKNRFTFSMEPNSNIVAGTKVQCRLRMTDRENDRPVYVEALPITFVDNNRGFTTISGCKWVGVSKRKLCFENEYQCEFQFYAFQPGCYQISSFVWSYEANSLDKNQATITHVFRVLPKPVDLLGTFPA